MIVPRAVLAPLLLLCALMTLSVTFNAGIGAAPAAFFGESDTLLIAPTDQLPGQAEIDASLVGPMRALPGVQWVSPEIYAPTVVDGHSLMVRGVEFDAFLALDDAELVRGALPAEADEVLVGKAAARLLDLDVGDVVVLPGAKGGLALPARVAGVFDAPGPARDEVLVPLAMARDLGRLGPDEAHIVRIRADEPARVLNTIQSVGAHFTYSDVRLAPAEVLPGEPVTLHANLTNWGRVAGAKVVEVRQNETVLAEAAYRVEPRTTIAITVPFHVPSAGVTNVTVNPTLPLVVRAPTLHVVGLPAWGVEGDRVNVQVVNESRVPVADVRIRGEGVDAITDEDGRASWNLSAPGHQRFTAYRNGTAEAVVRLFVADDALAHEAHARVHRFEARAVYVSVNESTEVQMEVENVGGVKGIVELVLTVDGEPVGTAAADIAPGRRQLVTGAFQPLAEGEHALGVEGWDGNWTVVAVHGDPEIEAILRAYEQPPATTGGTAPVAAGSADDYLTRILGNITAAVLALSIASAALAALAAGVVIKRHLDERARSLGTLKALGADDAWILDAATREAVLLSAAAATGGLALGVAAAEALDATGIVRAFGHAIHPVYTWASLGLLFVLTIMFVALVVRHLVGGMLRAPADRLMRAARTSESEAVAPDLEALLGGRS